MKEKQTDIQAETPLPVSPEGKTLPKLDAIVSEVRGRFPAIPENSADIRAGEASVSSETPWNELPKDTQNLIQAFLRSLEKGDYGRLNTLVKGMPSELKRAPVASATRTFCMESIKFSPMHMPAEQLPNVLWKNLIILDQPMGLYRAYTEQLRPFIVAAAQHNLAMIPTEQLRPCLEQFIQFAESQSDSILAEQMRSLLPQDISITTPWWKRIFSSGK